MSGIIPYFVFTWHFGQIQYFRSPKILSVPGHHWAFHTHLAHVHQKRDNTWNTQIYPSEDRVPNRIFQQSYPTQTRPILKKTYPLGPWYRISQWHYQSRFNHSSCHLSNPETQSELKLENMSALTMDWRLRDRSTQLMQSLETVLCSSQNAKFRELVYGWVKWARYKFPAQSQYIFTWHQYTSSLTQMSVSSSSWIKGKVDVTVRHDPYMNCFYNPELLSKILKL